MLLFHCGIGNCPYVSWLLFVRLLLLENSHRIMLFSGKEKLSLSSLVVFMTKLSWLCSLFPSTLTYIALLSCLLCAGAWKELSCQPLCYRAGQTVPVSSLQPGFLGWPGRQRSFLYIIVTCLSLKWVLRTVNNVVEILQGIKAVILPLLQIFCLTLLRILFGFFIASPH